MFVGFLGQGFPRLIYVYYVYVFVPLSIYVLFYCENVYALIH